MFLEKVQTPLTFSEKSPINIPKSENYCTRQIDYREKIVNFAKRFWKNRMRKLVLTIAATIIGSLTVNAQNIRLGERLPDIQAEVVIGTRADLDEHDIVCLIFLDTRSEPCIEAMKQMNDITNYFDGMVATLLITGEEEEEALDILNSYSNKNTLVAIDHNYRTFNSLDVKYVPFGIIYQTERRRVIWFGSIQQLYNNFLKLETNN